MKPTTTDGGLGSGDGRDESELRGSRSVSKILWVRSCVGIEPRARVHRACGAASCGFVQRGGWPAHIDGEVLFERWGGDGAAPPMLRISRVVGEVGGARALVPVAARVDVCAVQPRSMSSGGQRSEQRRRGRLGAEGAVSIQRKVNAGCGSGRVISSSSLLKGSGTAPGSAQGSLSNYRLKLTARGRPGANALRRARAAA